MTAAASELRRCEISIFASSQVRNAFYLLDRLEIAPLLSVAVEAL